jgi:hypothetical protein
MPKHSRSRSPIGGGAGEATSHRREGDRDDDKKSKKSHKHHKEGKEHKKKHKKHHRSSRSKERVGEERDHHRHRSERDDERRHRGGREDIPQDNRYSRDSSRFAEAPPTGMRDEPRREEFQ